MESGVAVSVTLDRDSNFASHVPPQDIPDGDEVTFPLPLPLVETVSRLSTGPCAVGPESLQAIAMRSRDTATAAPLRWVGHALCHAVVVRISPRAEVLLTRI
jgi:hypothetical protein